MALLNIYVFFSEIESVGSASCESYASGQSMALSLQGETYSHSQITPQPLLSVGLYLNLLTTIIEICSETIGPNTYSCDTGHWCIG